MSAQQIRLVGEYFFKGAFLILGFLAVTFINDIRENMARVQAHAIQLEIRLTRIETKLEK